LFFVCNRADDAEKRREKNETFAFSWLADIELERLEE